MRALSLQLKPRSLEQQIQERSVLQMSKEGPQGERMSRKEETFETRQLKRRRRPDGKQRTHFVEESTDQYDVYAVYHLSSDRQKSFKVDLKLCARKTRWQSTRVLWRRYLINWSNLRKIAWRIRLWLQQNKEASKRNKTLSLWKVADRTYLVEIGLKKFAWIGKQSFR